PLNVNNITNWKGAEVIEPTRAGSKGRDAKTPALCDPGKSRHHFDKGGLKLVHLILRTHAHSNVSRPGRPSPADVDLFGTQTADHFLRIALYVDHEAIRDALNVAEVLLFQEVKDILADIRDDLAAFRNEILYLQARAGCSHARDRHHGRTPALNLL